MRPTIVAPLTRIAIADGLFTGSALWPQQLGVLMALVLALIGSLTPARAQSAEAEVAFFMWGLEGAPSGNNTWAIEHQVGARSTIKIKQVGECHYHVYIPKQLTNQVDALRFDYVLDFSVVTEYDAWIANDHGSAIIIKIEGTKWYSKKVVNLKDGRVVQAINGGSVDANVAAGGSVERLRKAFADFRARRCRGDAF